MGSTNSLSQKAIRLNVSNNKNPKTLFEPQLMTQACTGTIHPYTITPLPAGHSQIVTEKAQEVFGKYIFLAMYRVSRKGDFR